MQAVEANIPGVLERSVSRMAACASMLAPGVSARRKHVEDALVELTKPRGSDGRPLAHWWPQLEVLWVVEAADEQTSSDLSWASVEALVPTWPAAVRGPFLERYEEQIRAAAERVAEAKAKTRRKRKADVVTDGPVEPLPDRGADGPAEASVQDQDQKQGTEAGSGSPQPPGGGRPGATGHSSGFVHEFRYRWAAIVAELGAEESDLPYPLAGRGETLARKLEGLEAARDYGDAKVLEVVRFTAKAATQGLPHAFLARIFVADGFQARLADYAEDQRKRRGRAAGVEVDQAPASRLSADSITEVLSKAEFARGEDGKCCS